MTGPPLQAKLHSNGLFIPCFYQGHAAWLIRQGFYVQPQKISPDDWTLLYDR
jgi:hypothetical protein